MVPARGAAADDLEGAAEGVGEGFASPRRDDDSRRELERALGVLARRENRRRIYEQLADRAGIEIEPEQSWVLGRVRERAPIAEDALADDLGARARAARRPARRAAAARPRRRGDPIELTPTGRETYERLVDARRVELERLLDGWSPEEHDELQGMVDRLARDLVAEMPSAG